MRKNILILAILSTLSVNAFAAVTDSEKEIATDHLISILKKTNYFNYIDTRIHGWPKSDPSKKFWWGSMWSGVRIIKKNGQVTYLHPDDGSDNNGFRTASLLESMCFAQSMSPRPEWEYQIQKMVRGFSSWILAGESSARPNTPKVLSRAHYTENVTAHEDGFEFLTDFSQTRPGKDNVSTQYVEIKDNPTFGHIWIKNSRSLDDIPEMIRAITQLKSCEATLSTETKEDIAQMRALYALWAADAESNNFQFPSINKNNEYNRNNAPMTKFTRQFLPTGLLAIRLLYNPDPGSLGHLNPLDVIAEAVLGKLLNNDAYEMLRAAHVAALIQAKTLNNQQLIKKLNKRLKDRLDNDTDYITGKRTSSKIYKPDISGVFINAVNAGFPITDFQTRHIYKSLEVADQTIPAHDPMFYVFDTSTPDGEYTFEATDPGMPFRAIGLLFGSCSSAFKDAEANKVLNCQKIEDYFKSLK